MKGGVRLQQRVEELCGASIRALANDARLRFRGQRLVRGDRPVALDALHLAPSLEDDDFASFRGAADGMALRVAFSDPALHARLAPAAPYERRIFDLLEQFRAESRVAERWPGVRHNLRHRHEQWSLAFHHDGMTATVQGLLFYAAIQVCRARVMAEQVVEETEDRIESSRMQLAPRLGVALAGLRRERLDQAAYAPHAKSVARTLASMLSQADDAEARRPVAEVERERRLRLSLWLQGEGGDDALPAAAVGVRRAVDDAGPPYRVYTTAYDRELRAGPLVRAEMLAGYRERLDALAAASGLNVPRLAREFRALLALPQRDDWIGAQEEGIIDGRRLAQLVSSPTERRLFRQERPEPTADCVLAFLVDCSGSMKQHMETVALLVDIAARALGLADVACEVLGFSTGAWNGGRARQDWLKAGRPPSPGRLNEAWHLVFKDAETPWRRGRRDIAALLRPELFREGIDGEALSWACDRLRGRAERRRIVVAISDGCPMDGATMLANPDPLLETHLREVVDREARLGDVEVCAIGVGLDLGALYPRSRVLDIGTRPDHAWFAELMRLVGPSAAR